MLLVHKNVGETPLELIERIRLEKPELEKEKLSYAGRLDPMAEGLMLILVGGEENKNREKFLGLDKEYIATFLVGAKTDTGDALGLVESSIKGSSREGAAGHGSEKEEVLKKIERGIEQGIEQGIENIKKIKVQKYPWFSGHAVNGIKLFDHFKAGNVDIERPSRKVEIKEIELLNFAEEPVLEIKNYIFDSVSKVSGNFRQKEILARWQDFFEKIKDVEIAQGNKGVMQTFQIRILVSSGTYIRALTENFGFPVVLLKLKRTEIKFDGTH